MPNHRRNVFAELREIQRALFVGEDIAAARVKNDRRAVPNVLLAVNGAPAADDVER